VEYVAALLVVAGVALYVASPLISGDLAGARIKGRERSLDREMDRAMQERSLTVQALSELEFDREMSKLSEEDYRTLRAPLESRALGAMAEIERLHAEHRAEAAALPAATAVMPPPRAIKPVERGVRRVAFCPQCGKRIRMEANFCVECGASLSPVKGLAMQAE